MNTRGVHTGVEGSSTRGVHTGCETPILTNPLKGVARGVFAEEKESGPTPEPVLAPVGRMHRATCRRSIDEWGDRWHSAACEGGGANYRYALAFSGDKRYARSIAAWVTP